MIIPKGHIKHVPNHQPVFACFGLVVSLLGLRIEEFCDGLFGSIDFRSRGDVYIAQCACGTR